MAIVQDHVSLDRGKSFKAGIIYFEIVPDLMRHVNVWPRLLVWTIDENLKAQMVTNQEEMQSIAPKRSRVLRSTISTKRLQIITNFALRSE